MDIPHQITPSRNEKKTAKKKTSNRCICCVLSWNRNAHIKHKCIKFAQSILSLGSVSTPHPDDNKCLPFYQFSFLFVIRRKIQFFSSGERKQTHFTCFKTHLDFSEWENGETRMKQLWCLNEINFWLKKRDCVKIRGNQIMWIIYVMISVSATPSTPK